MAKQTIEEARGEAAPIEVTPEEVTPGRITCKVPLVELNRRSA